MRVRKGKLERRVLWPEPLGMEWILAFEVLVHGGGQVELVRRGGDDSLAHEAQHSEAFLDEPPTPPALHPSRRTQPDQALDERGLHLGAARNRTPHALQGDRRKYHVDRRRREWHQELGKHLGRQGRLTGVYAHRPQQVRVARARRAQHGAKVDRIGQHEAHELPALVGHLHAAVLAVGGLESLLKQAQLRIGRTHI